MSSAVNDAASGGGDNRGFSDSCNCNDCQVCGDSRRGDLLIARVAEGDESPTFRLRCLAKTPSTNEEVKRALEKGEPEGLVVRSLVQTGGYGRQGRTWASPRGGLYMSLLLRPQVPMTQLPTASLLVAIAVRRALVSLTDAEDAPNIQVKWPNDIVCAQGKLCGISLEAHAGGLCVGIGVNVFPPEETVQVGGKNRPAYLSDFAEATLDEVAQAILRQITPCYGQWQAEGLEPFLEEYRSHASLTGRYVQMVTQTDDPLAEGTVEGVDTQGCLLLRTKTGQLVPVSSGEAHIL